MGRGVQGAVLRMLRVPEYRLMVTRVTTADPYTDITVVCPPLLGEGAEPLPPTVWARMWIPEGMREHQRAYTLTDVNRKTASAHILVFHHEPNGPASRWALTTVPGDEVSAQIMGGTRYRTPEPGQRMLLVGDPASAPAMVEAVNAADATCRIVVVLQSSDDSPPLPGREHRLIRVPPEDPAALTDAVQEALGRARPDWAWVALESAATKSIRRLVGSAGVPRRAIQAQAYWIRGRAMGT